MVSAQYTGMDCNYLEWDLKDMDGDELANGVYLYKVSAEGRDAEGKSVRAEEVKKIAILR